MIYEDYEVIMSVKVIYCVFQHCSFRSYQRLNKKGET